MTDQQNEIQALRDRVSDLEDKVETLVSERDETAQRGARGRETKVDHYDSAAIEQLPRHSDFKFSTVKAAYTHAGVRDTRKIKDRVEYLVRIGKLEKSGRRTWAVADDE